MVSQRGLDSPDHSTTPKAARRKGFDLMGRPGDETWTGGSILHVTPRDRDCPARRSRDEDVPTPTPVHNTTPSPLLYAATNWGEEASAVT